MTFSQALLLLAVLVAALPIAAVGPRPPASLRDFEKAGVVGAVVGIVGLLVIHRVYGLKFFGLAHLGYLLGVVSLPLLLGGWYVLGAVRRRHTVLTRVGGFVALLAVLVGTWGTHIEPNWLKTDVVSLSAPPLSQPITIGVLADMQTPNVGKHEQRAVDTIIEQAPDLVLIPGDFFQGPPLQIEAETPNFIALLQQLREAAGTVAIVSGDSDWRGQLKPMAEAAEVLYIDNAIVELQIAGQPIRLAGVSVDGANGERLNTLAALSAPVDAYTILLSHRPDAVFDLADDADVDLVVAGHTHGGQVSIPFYGPPVTFSAVPRSLAAGGLEFVEGHAVYVSAGVGMERFQAPQIRLNSRPEVGVVELVP